MLVSRPPIEQIQSLSATSAAASAIPQLSPEEERSRKRQAARRRKELINFTVGTFFFAVLVGGVIGLIGGLKAGVGTIAALLFLPLSYKYPRTALWAFFIYLPFGGTITYMIGNSPLLQLAKDGLYLPALFGLYQQCRRERQSMFIPKQLLTPLIILILCCLLTFFSANVYQQFFGADGEKPIAMGILGFKVLIGYAPLIPCAYYLIRHKKDTFFLMRLSSLLIVICCGLAMVQYLMLLTGKCAGTRFEEGADLFKASLEARCFVGGALLYSPQQGVIRLPGTFVAPWQWGWFLISSTFFGFASAFSDPKFHGRILGLAAMGLTFVLAVVSGQRIALALVPTVIGLLLLLTGQVANLKRFIPIGVALGLALSIAALKNPATVQERINSFIVRWQASPPDAFIRGQFFWAMKEGGFLGAGLGRATNSARALGRTELVETYYPKLLYEMGPLGALAFFAVVTTLTIVTFKVYRSLRDRNFRGYGAALWVFVLFISYNTYYYPLDVDPVAVYYWFFAGVILKLPEVERLAKLEPDAELDEPPDPKQKKRTKKLRKKKKKRR
ncbi:MAG: hormogonium polysaccharide biosynthesis protein HpsL [Elainella sp. Prado103]|nr:hormogonium polysaccharide biosynthesis protein HpsL [Elainella sp. Prado103]